MDNELVSAVTHLIGTVGAIAALVLLIVFSSLYATVWHIVGFTIFGTTMVLLYLASTLYHSFPKTNKAKKVFQILDHSMIYMLIAGTYTGVILSVFRTSLGWTMFGIIWGLAILGIVIKVVKIRLKEWVGGTIYLLMGWIVVIALKPLIDVITLDAFWYLLAGGLFYSFGVIFFALDHKVKRIAWLGMHDIFHIFIMLGSLSHFWLMFHYLMYL